MQTKTIEVYDFDELTQEAKDKARNTYNETVEYPFLQDDLREYITDRKGNEFEITHSARYYHERSVAIVGEDIDGEEIDTKDFKENVYIPICLQVRDRGYNQIEYQESEEYFTETCEANEWIFLKDGTITNK